MRVGKPTRDMGTQGKTSYLVLCRGGRGMLSTMKEFLTRWPSTTTYLLDIGKCGPLPASPSSLSTAVRPPNIAFH
ncbi:unnamed protein product [Lupinus luteus]|uniref:Uncharacterized protein n=1 Tax=Lupinus luteus TaxID=3873 RepID=A0AAV1WBX8_LUPLU